MSPAIASTLASLAPDRIFLVTDERVGSIHGPRIEAALSIGYKVNRLVIPMGEAAKSLATVERLCEEALAAGATRCSVVAALGGGAVGNTAGVLAGLLFRGIRLLHMPTTLLAASDSVISLKQAVNSRFSKNSFGLYHEPSGVIIDLTCLDTLPNREINSGLAELVKNALAIAPETLDTLLGLISEPRPWVHQIWMRLIALGVQAKCRVMAGDPYEKTTAVVLEYGHTVGHAIEIVDAHRRPGRSLNHGESVALGMRVAARVSSRLGYASAGLIQRHDSVLKAVGLACHFPAELPIGEILGAVARDNKRGRIAANAAECAMVLLKDCGRPVAAGDLPLEPVPMAVVQEVVEDLAGHSRLDCEFGASFRALCLTAPDGQRPGF